ncbi:MAG: imidazolonepropionase [Chloroflexi bacterium]|nr:imidazolonepropionase [Chloroflexota bacterium]
MSSLRLIQGGRAADGLPGLLIENAGEVVTMAGGLRRGTAQDEPEIVDWQGMPGGAGGTPGGAGGVPGGDGGAPDPGGAGGDRGAAEAAARGPAALDAAPAVACWEGRILAVGPRAELLRAMEGGGFPLARFARVDAAGGTVTPGLVDPHTHLLFAGAREGELVMRQRGAGYLDILAAGGGILSTVAATRAASAEQLEEHGRRWLGEMLAHGTTTIEAKSGYGLDLATELRLIDVAHRLGKAGPIEILPTWLGAHAVPPEFRSRPDGAEAYVRHCIEEQLPGVAAQGRARFADVFCEAGVFTAEQSRRVLEAAVRYGLAPRLHADEIAPSGGAELAAEIGALSADHLAAPSKAGIEALARAADGEHPVVATLLPATTWFLMHDDFAPARTLIDRGVPVALATDFNPGTSPTTSLPLVMTVACLELKLTPSEALAAVTINAAHAVGRGDEIGSIEPGKAADLVIWRVPTHRQLPYWPAADLVRSVVKGGRVVLEKPPA